MHGTQFERITAAIDKEYAALKYKKIDMERPLLTPVRTFQIYHSHTFVSLLMAKRLRKAARKILELPGIGPILHSLLLIPRLGKHLRRVRADIAHLRFEIQKIDADFMRDERLVAAWTNRFTDIEQRIAHLEGKTGDTIPHHDT